MARSVVLARRRASAARQPAPSSTRRATRTGALIVIGLTLLAARGEAQTPPVYQAEFIGTGAHVAAMNNAGSVVYSGTVGVVSRAYVGGPGQPGSLLLMPFGLISSEGIDINEAGVIVGNVSPWQSTGLKAYPGVWNPDGAGGYLLATVPNLLPGDDRGTAGAINDVGDILGTSSFTSTTHVVRFVGANAVELPGLGSLPAYSVNDQRVYVSGNKLVHVDTLQVETLPVPAGYASATGWVINDSGQVAGELGVSGCGSEAAIYTPGLGWQSLSACGSGNSAYAMNAGGDVLMKLDGVPYLYLAGVGTWRVEDLIDDAAGHWTVNSLFGIALNDGRQVALVASNATSGQSGVVLLTPSGETCQTDLGFGGPGNMQLSMCGGDLSSGTSADLSLTGGVPNATAFLLLGVQSNVVPFKGGFLLPVPWLMLLPLPLDGTGAAALPGLPGGGGPLSVYAQAAMHDASQAKGFAMSNALRVDFLP